MSETKKELRWFSIMDYEKEARYLSRMHQKGWKFKRVTMPGIYTCLLYTSPSPRD